MHGLWRQVLHGAMAAVSFPDVEEELVRRLRAHPAAAGVPIVGVVDLHGNLSRATAEGTDGHGRRCHSLICMHLCKYFRRNSPHSMQ